MTVIIYADGIIHDKHPINTIKHIISVLNVAFSYLRLILARSVMAIWFVGLIGPESQNNHPIITIKNP